MAYLRQGNVIYAKVQKTTWSSLNIYKASNLHKKLHRLAVKVNEFAYSEKQNKKNTMAAI